MRVATKGQVAIPQVIRERLGITPATEVDFIEENGRVYLGPREKKEIAWNMKHPNQHAVCVVQNLRARE